LDLRPGVNSASAVCQSWARPRGRNGSEA